MKILIIGASSYVGASIYSRLKDQDKYSVIGTYYSHRLFPELKKLDITKEEDVKDFFLTNKPDMVIHVAANANIGWCENNPELAVAINQDGTLNIVKAANENNSKIIFISSFAAMNNYSLYGRTKIASEQYVRRTKSGYVILRPSLIIGFSPNTINDRTFNKLLRNVVDKVSTVYDTSWKFHPTWLRHLGEVIEKIIEREIVNETISVSVSELKTRYEIAKDILSEFDVDVNPENKQDKTPTLPADINKLRELKLPQYTYEEMIDGIIKEIKDYLKRN